MPWLDCSARELIEKRQWINFNNSQQYQTATTVKQTVYGAFDADNELPSNMLQASLESQSYPYGPVKFRLIGIVVLYSHWK